MYPYEERKQPSLWNLAVIALVFVGVAGFAILSLSTGDALWFWPVFSEQPSRISLYCYGEEVSLAPGAAQFDGLTTLFNQTLSGFQNWDSLSLSEETWAHYRTNAQSLTLVFHYAEPVRVHSMYKYFSGVDTLVMPLDGRHAGTYAVFGLTDTVRAAGSLHVQTHTPLVEFLAEQDLCHMKDLTTN